MVSSATILVASLFSTSIRRALLSADAFDGALATDGLAGRRRTFFMRGAFLDVEDDNDDGTSFDASRASPSTSYAPKLCARGSSGRRSISLVLLALLPCAPQPPKPSSSSSLDPLADAAAAAETDVVVDDDIRGRFCCPFTFWLAGAIANSRSSFSRPEGPCKDDNDAGVDAAPEFPEKEDPSARAASWLESLASDTLQEDDKEEEEDEEGAWRGPALLSLRPPLWRGAQKVLARSANACAAQ